jgi:hypothetical protein
VGRLHIARRNSPNRLAAGQLHGFHLDKRLCAGSHNGLSGLGGSQQTLDHLDRLVRPARHWPHHTHSNNHNIPRERRPHQPCPCWRGKSFAPPEMVACSGLGLIRSIVWQSWIGDVVRRRTTEVLF